MELQLEGLEAGATEDRSQPKTTPVCALSLPATRARERCAKSDDLRLLWLQPARKLGDLTKLLEAMTRKARSSSRDNGFSGTR
jgi:hypothetical protein